MISLVLLTAVFSGCASSYRRGPEISYEESGNSSMERLSFLLQLLEDDYFLNSNLEPIADSLYCCLLGAMDPYTVSLPAGSAVSVPGNAVSSGERAGFSASVISDTLVVTGVDGGSPAWMSGLRSGDRILSVNGIRTIFDTVHQGNLRQLFQEESEVLLVHVCRGKQHKELKICKRPYMESSVRFFVPADGMLFIRMAEFTDSSAREINDIVCSVRPESLILDLRGNPGGTVSSVQRLASLFVGPGKLVATAYYRDSRCVQLRSVGRGPVSSCRLAVLVDRNTMSAAEMFSALVQDYDRGIVVGESTYGKGSISRSYSMPGGDILVLTVGRYCSPSGRCIEKRVGAEPVMEYFRSSVYGRMHVSGSGIVPDLCSVDSGLVILQNNASFCSEAVRYADSIAFTELGLRGTGPGSSVSGFSCDSVCAAVSCHVEDFSVLMHAKGVAVPSEDAGMLSGRYLSSLVVSRLCSESEGLRIWYSEDPVFRMAENVVSDPLLYGQILSGEPEL